MKHQRAKWRLRLISPLAVFGTALITITAVATPANAINRASTCKAQYDQLFSNATTCWINFGGVSVELYNVSGQSSGNNAGCYNAINYQNNGTSFTNMVLFYKYYNFSWTAFHETVQFLYHNPAGTESYYCAT